MDKEIINKLTTDGKEITVPVGNGKTEKIWWQKLGFGSQMYFDIAVIDRINEAKEKGLIHTKKIKTPIPLEGTLNEENTFFYFKEGFVDPDSVKIFINNIEVIESDYSVISNSFISFVTPPPERPVATYNYFRKEAFRSLKNVAVTSMAIYLSARKLDNHGENYFESAQQVCDLLQTDEIIAFNKVIDEEINIAEKELKKSPAVQNIEPGSDTAKEEQGSTSGTADSGVKK